MSKKIPKLIIYGVTTIPTIIVLACGEPISIGESISIKDKSQLVIKTKSKQKDIITKIIIPAKDDKKHDASLFDAINLARKKVIKAINDAKTIANAIKVGKDGVIALDKAIKDYKDSKGTEYKSLQTDKAKFNSFKHLIVGKEILVLEDGSTTAEKLEELIGHNKIPSTTEGVNRTFAIKTSSETGISTVTVTFAIGDLTDAKTYKISGFKIINSDDFSNGFMYQIKKGTIYVGTNQGLKKLEDGNLINVGPTDLEYGFMYQTEDDTIYVLKNGSLKKLEGDKTINVDFTNIDNFHFCYQTKEGIVYWGTENGLKKLEKNILKIVDPTNVRTGFMYQTKDDTIYVGTYDKGLKKLVNDGSGGKRLDPVNSIDLGEGFMYQTQDDTIYVGTYNQGLMKLVDDEKGGKKLDLVDSVNVKNGFMHQTKDGTIYVGTRYNGLKKLDGDKLIDVDTIDLIDGFIYQTQDGTIYIGTKIGLKKFPKS